MLAFEPLSVALRLPFGRGPAQTDGVSHRAPRLAVVDPQLALVFDETEALHHRHQRRPRGK